MNSSLIYVNPQSYNNLERYDYMYLGLLNKYHHLKITYACSHKTCLNAFPSDLQFYPIFSYHSLSPFPKLLSYIRSMLKIIGLCSTFKFVHFQWFIFPPFDFIVLLILRFLYPSLIIIHTSHNPSPRPFSSKFINFFYTLCLVLCHRLLCHSVPSKNCLDQRLCFSKAFIKVLIHGQTPPNYSQFLYSSIPSNRIFSLPYDPSKKYFLFIGSDSPYKGLSILLRAWTLLPNDVKSKFQLVICGQINSSPTHDILLDKSISFFGHHVSDIALTRFVDVSSYIILPHVSISHSGIYSTYLSSKKPFLYNSTSHNHMHSHEAFTHTGFPFDNSPSSLLDLLTSIYLDPSKFSVSEDSWREAFDYFTWDNSLNITTINSIYS